MAASFDHVVVDFETKPILTGSGLAPAPVGVSILVPGEHNVYLSWGHPGENNSTYEFARRALASVWDRPLVFHNCKFDIGVAMQHMDLPWPKRYDDTMFLLYLYEPLSNDLGLKPSSERLLGLPPDEKDAVYEWLRANFKGPFLADHKMVTKKNAGAYISYAPYEIVAPYAMGDTSRTRELFGLLRPKISAMEMDEAYARELKIARIGYDMERVGVRVDRARLAEDYEKYERIKHEQEATIVHYLGDIDVDKPMQVAEAILERGFAEDLPRTPTERLSTAKGAFEAHVNDKGLLQALRYRGALKTLTQTFFKGWVDYSARDGFVHPSWNQVRQGAKGFIKGARTGRFSCDAPNFTNVPTEFEEPTLRGLDLPFMRQYILPDEGQVIMPADFNGQEMRILAHYSEGQALLLYNEDPFADFHKVAARMVKSVTGMDIDRRVCKIVGFSLIYGSGIATLAAQLTAAGYPTDEEQASDIRNAYFRAFPGLRAWMDLFRRRDRVRTWGGRSLPCDTAREMPDGRWAEFQYKLVNYLIQGSAADQAKEGMIRYDESDAQGRLLMMVHDELVVSTPDPAHDAPRLRSAMEDMPGWDVPFKVEIETGHDWHNLEKYT